MKSILTSRDLLILLNLFQPPSNTHQTEEALKGTKYCIHETKFQSTRFNQSIQKTKLIKFSNLFNLFCENYTQTSNATILQTDAALYWIFTPGFSWSLTFNLFRFTLKYLLTSIIRIGQQASFYWVISRLTHLMQANKRNMNHYLIRISPRFPENCPSMYSSVLASCNQ
jgi:hypothetical protein